ncbi:MAG: hypothetical protein GKR87_05830 [Kiritimatiellae bacterium]|nr:hypothetical protein [Kiritimatiellia bacterium]
MNKRSIFLCSMLVACLFHHVTIAESEKETAPPLSQAERALKKITLQRDQLAAENTLRDEQLKTELHDSSKETKKLRSTYILLQERVKMERFKLQTERSKLELENALEAAKHQKEVENLKVEIEKLDLENLKVQKMLQKQLADLAAKKQKTELENLFNKEKDRQSLSQLERERDTLALENAKAHEEVRKLEITLNKEQQNIKIEMARLGLESKRAAFKQKQYRIALTQLNSDLELRQKRETWKSEVNQELEYNEEPFGKGVLTISDRRIPLNGPIIKGTADYVTERIHYFNNKSQAFPIFIMIDRCPGGSAMERYRILKAMEASKAPIHVVVKSFAASMAAIILTLAEHSYAYPNAIILHHQPLSIVHGENLTQQQEQLETLKEWARRLHLPVAKKMERSLKEFYAQMYEKRSTGDWEEFADRAKKLKMGRFHCQRHS